MALRIRVYIDIDEVAAGTGGTLLGQSQANNPGYGPGAVAAGAVGSGQTLRRQDSVSVPGTPGSYTLANLNTALTQAVTDFAAATGTTIITAADVAQINGWNSGSP